MKRLMTGFLLFLMIGARAQQLDPSHYVPVKKELSAEWKEGLWTNERKAYKGEELKTIGMPCGGIAAGQLYVRGDGTLANWWISNNAYNTGYGKDSLMNFQTALGPYKVCYQTFQPPSFIDQGVSVKVKQANKERSVTLSEKDFDDISFIGEYPIARINYASRKNPLPLKIDAEVFSPFIPMNSRESATPGTILKYTFRNDSKAPMDITMTGWLQNLVCLDIASELSADSRNTVVKNNGITSVVMDLVKKKNAPVEQKSLTVFEDFESGNYGKWKVTGTAFGAAPSRDALPDQQPVSGQSGSYYISSFNGGDSAQGELSSQPFVIQNDYIIFSIGGGSSRGKTVLQLVVGDKVVRSATGKNSEELEFSNWDVKPLKGSTAFFRIVDKATGDWGHINVDQLGFSDYPSVKGRYFPEGHPYFGNITISLLADNAKGIADYYGASGSKADAPTATLNTGDKLVGAASSSFTLKAGESRTLTLLVSWYFPYRPQNYGDGGNWTRAIPTRGPSIGNMYANWYGSSLDVALWLKNNFTRLSDQTHAFHSAYYNTTLPYWLAQRIMMPVSTLATETSQWWATDKFWAWEGVGSCVGTCTHVYNYAHAMARLFPDLERNVREKTDFGTSFQDNGSVLSRNGWGGVLIDGHAGAILKAYREHLQSDNNIFLSRNWAKIKKAMEFLISEDGNEDGALEKAQANTYDIAFYGFNTYVGSLYLAALKSTALMAEVMDDPAFAKKCMEIFAKGQKNTEQKLWTGEYYKQDVNLKEHARFQYAQGCLSDQLFGQTWSHINNSGYLYPKENVKTALQSIWKYNWAEDVGVQNKQHPPERTFADAGEPGLLICTWPRSAHPGEDGVRYRDEIWTGIEYQVATNMIYEGMIDEAMSMVKAVHERYRPEKHNPWNEIECGDHYARAMASWGLLVALEDFYFNGPAKSLKFVPQVQKENFKAFFTGAVGWGSLAQMRTAAKQTNTLSVSYGDVALQTLEVEALNTPKKVQLYVGKKEIPSSFTVKDHKLTVSFNELTIRATERLELSVTF